MSVSNSITSTSNNQPSLKEIPVHILEKFAADYAFNINPDLSQDLRLKLLNLFYNHKDAFARSFADLKKFNKREFEIRLTDNKPLFQKQYKVSEDHAKIIEQHITDWQKQGIVHESFDYFYNNPIFLVSKASLKDALPHDRLNPKHYRSVLDLRALNKKIHKQVIYTPSPKDILDEIMQYRILHPGEPAVRSSGYILL
jgi:hypothetical protein